MLMKPSEVTFGTLTSLHIAAVRRYAEANGEEVLFAQCKRATARIDWLTKLGAMRAVAEAYNKLNASGMLS